MDKNLESAEHLSKWVIVITAIVLFFYKAYKFIKKTIIYIKKSNERYDLLVSIADNQDYGRLERKAIMDKINLAYFITDLEGKAIEIGDLVCKIFGYAEEELLGFKWSSFIIAADRDRVMSCVIEDLKYGRNGDLRYSIITYSGEIKSVHVVAKKSKSKYFCTLEVL